MASGLLQLAQIGAVDGQGCSEVDGLGLFWLAGRQAQAGQQKLPVLGLAKGHIARYDEWGNGAQPGDDPPRFVEPPQMGITRGKIAV